MELVFATNNINKLEEVKKMLPKHIKLLSLKDIGCNADIAETGKTLSENANIKSDYIHSTFKLNCFSDDTGLEVEVLHNAPGVYTARYAGEQATSEDNMQKLLRKLQNKPNRKAKFKTVISLILDDKEYQFEGVCNGIILKEKTGKKGFGYDPIFQPKGYDKSFAQMTKEEKAVVSHRGKAIKKLVDFLSNYKN
ncbi:MAG TPA: non-canonical purine NTP diphosphatase [Flavobacteriia bacterium]|jgi:XTP/dITP diphosphohydrolase|nr:non-canonical purine NTP diphosphatase [Flavobacteriia bacterium]